MLEVTSYKKYKLKKEKLYIGIRIRYTSNNELRFFKLGTCTLVPTFLLTLLASASASRSYFFFTSFGHFTHFLICCLILVPPFDSFKQQKLHLTCSVLAVPPTALLKRHATATFFLPTILNRILIILNTVRKTKDSQQLSRYLISRQPILTI